VTNSVADRRPSRLDAWQAAGAAGWNYDALPPYQAQLSALLR